MSPLFPPLDPNHTHNPTCNIHLASCPNAENTFLIWSLLLCGVGAFTCASNALPVFNKLMQLVEYPSEGFRQQLVMVCCMYECIYHECKQGSSGGTCAPFCNGLHTVASRWY